ncbi:MAG: DNA repair protein RecO [Coriobacteriia bacterium]|nr:DNA repair protein RecO [Coriobacteriia bacterium]
MGSRTYNADVLVLNKTKLGETDLILTLLAEDGRQLRAVARGARKPTSSFSSRLELYSTAHAQLIERSGLDIVREVRLINGRPEFRSDLDKCAAAAPVAELLAKITQEGLAHDRLFELSNATLDAICAAGPDHASLLCAAGLLKICAFAGFRPSLRSCASCGGQKADSLRFSFDEGGFLCESCASHGTAAYLDPAVAQWLDVLMYSTFAQLTELAPNQSAAAECIDFARRWIRTHVGAQLKSCAFLLQCGMAR